MSISEMVGVYGQLPAVNNNNSINTNNFSRGEKFCLRWTRHPLMLYSALEEKSASIATEDDIEDCTADICFHLNGGKKIRAHSVVLASTSQYLREVGKEGCENILLPDTDPADLQALLAFLYTGQTNIKESRLDDIVLLARALGVYSLLQATQHCFQQNSLPQADRSPNDSIIAESEPELAEDDLSERVTPKPPANKRSLVEDDTSAEDSLPARLARPVETAQNPGKRYKPMAEPMLQTILTGQNPLNSDTVVGAPRQAAASTGPQGTNEDESEDGRNPQIIEGLTEGKPDAAALEGMSWSPQLTDIMCGGLSRLGLPNIGVLLQGPNHQQLASILTAAAKLRQVAEKAKQCNNNTIGSKENFESSSSGDGGRKLAFHEPRPCPTCKRMYRDAATLRTHTAIMHSKGSEPFRCTCGVSFETKFEMYQHKKSGHPPVTSN